MSKHVFTVSDGISMKSANLNGFTSISPVRRFWRHPLWAPFNQIEGWNRLLNRANPLWSLSEAMAQVIRVVDEAPGVKSLWLKPNRHFHGFRSGQHLLLTLEVNGARHSRCFSLSHAPRADGLIRLTIKRKDAGPVSNAAHSLKIGQVLAISQAQGNFAPRNPNGPLFFLSAGSGITPMLPLLQTLLPEKTSCSVVLLYVAQSDKDFIFADELEALAMQWPQFKYYFHATQIDGRFNAQHIEKNIPDWNMRETLLCGPDGFMSMVEAHYANAGRSAFLQNESFGRRAAAIDPNARDYSVNTANSLFKAKAGQPLLDAAETAGLQPKFGCRRGICRTCQCKKLSGTVKNLLTGQISGPGEELIQLCISSPQSALEIALNYKEDNHDK